MDKASGHDYTDAINYFQEQMLNSFKVPGHLVLDKKPRRRPKPAVTEDEFFRKY